MSKIYKLNCQKSLLVFTCNCVEFGFFKVFNTDIDLKKTLAVGKEPHRLRRFESVDSEISDVLNLVESYYHPFLRDGLIPFSVPLM